MSVNQEQQDFWSSEAGHKWVRYQREMDALFEPVLQLVLDHANLMAGETVLDVGCGAGTSTALATLKVGDTGRCTGIDISDTLLAHASRTLKSDNTNWLLADAQTHPFEPKTFDAMISRFGVMFFADPIVAFTNIRSALKPHGRVIMAAWGPAPKNPWFMLPAKAGKEQMGQMPKTDRSLPGPFAFEDQNRVMTILKEAGYSDIQTTTHDLGLTASNGLVRTAKLCCEIGPADGILRYFNGTLDDRNAIEKRIVELFKPFETKEGLHIPASIHLFTARVG